jgi:TolB-like protein
LKVRCWPPLLLGLAAFLLSACRPSLPTLDKLAPLPGEKICRIAVIPFASETNFPQAESIFYRVFLSELVRSGQFDVVQEGDVREVLYDLRILPGQQPQREQMKILGDRLGISLAITGSIVEMAEVPKRQEINPILAVTVRIVNAESGDTLWSTYHRREGEQYRKIMHFGMINNVTGLAHRISDEILARWLRGGLSGCVG